MIIRVQVLLTHWGASPKIILLNLLSLFCLLKFISIFIHCSHLFVCVFQSGGEMGKYTCLICQKEFSSESGVKYHISKTHSQVGLFLRKLNKRPLKTHFKKCLGIYQVLDELIVPALPVTALRKTFCYEILHKQWFVYAVTFLDHRAKHNL